MLYVGELKYGSFTLNCNNNLNMSSQKVNQKTQEKDKRYVKIVRVTQKKKTTVDIPIAQKEEELKQIELNNALKAGESLTCPWEKYINIRTFIDDCDKDPFSSTPPIDKRIFYTEITHVSYNDMLFLLECIIRKLFFYNSAECDHLNHFETWDEIYHEQIEYIISLLKPEDKDQWFIQFIEDILMSYSVDSLTDALIDLFDLLYDDIRDLVDLKFLFTNITSLTEDFCPEIVKINTKHHK